MHNIHVKCKMHIIYIRHLYVTYHYFHAGGLADGEIIIIGIHGNGFFFQSHFMQVFLP